MLKPRPTSHIVKKIAPLLISLFAGHIALSAPLTTSDHPLTRPIEGSLKINTLSSVDLSDTKKLTRINFTSQSWRGMDWKHDLALIEPNSGCSDWLYLHLGASRIKPLNEDYITTLSEKTGVTTAFISQIPNQPLFDNKKEDDLLSFTLSEYVKTIS